MTQDWLLKLDQNRFCSQAIALLLGVGVNLTLVSLTTAQILDHSQQMSQITSVSQLKDVQPTEWAYSALQSLVERYGCIAGYPDRTYRGDPALTRYEFATGLNSCLTKITDLIRSGTNILREDLTILQRLQQEFGEELANLSLRIDNLETRTAFLEDHQFSTNTKLHASISFAGLAYASAGEGSREAVIQQQSFIQFATSFTGQDQLSLGAVSTTSALPQLATTNNGRNVGFTNEGFTIWSYGGNTQADLQMKGSLEYIFPIINDGLNRWYMTVALEDGFNSSRYLLPRGAITWEGYNLNSGPISAFGQRNPLYRLGGGTGFITNYDRGPWRFTAAYLASQAFSPRPGEGLFNGDFLALTQLNFTPPDRNFAIAVTYFHNYFGPGRFAFNNQYKLDAESPGYVGTALANRFDNAGVFFDRDVPVVSNTVGLQAFKQLSPDFVLGGFVSKIDARLMGRGDANIWSGALSMSFPDLFREGNTGGLIVGVEPMLTGITGVDIPDFKRDTSWHIEAFYQYQVNNNISITPGMIWITAPNQDAENNDNVLGVIRTTFSF